MNILENDKLIIESKNSGAELTRIYSKDLKKEILWNGDSTHWSRHSPILFPIVGRLKDNKTYIEDKFYNMSQHGFARDMDFEIIYNDNTSITYRLISSDETKKLYPYSFELLIKYTIINNSINTNWIVLNKDTKDMYFSIGAHPAFNIYDDLCNYYLEFKSRDIVKRINLEGPYFNSVKEVYNLNNLRLEPKIFEKDALIYTNIDSINLKSNKSKDYINLNFKDFPLVGIWTPYYKDTNSTAPFVCIEPWFGLADSVNSDKIYTNKAYINKLKPLESFNSLYTITIEKE
ncbi:aldose 1-epimerase family protein [Romboutsia sp. MSSM.1001216sp_RTP31141st1_G3_RTP31141_220114]|uniref:aldose 1-epimerase family protein n=1 Tax=unclassified Romboutsia TaxID=2626894 RepID=UPI0031B5F449